MPYIGNDPVPLIYGLLNAVSETTTATSTTVADLDQLVLNDVSGASGSKMKQIVVTDLVAYLDDEITAMPNLVQTGALDAGSITSGFTSIDVGAGAITTTGVITGGTVEATTDTAAGDNAAIGYTSAEGLILTGQGSTNDVTIKNDADAIVMQIATGGTATEFIGNVTVGGNLDVTGSLDMSDANLTNVGSLSLDSLSGDADSNTSITFSGSDVITIATGGTTAMTIDASQNTTLAGTLTAVTSIGIGSAVLTEAEMEKLDGITNGTAAANKAVVLDASKNIGTIGTIASAAITSSGIIKTDDTTEATSTTDGSLQTDGGLSVAKDVVAGDDVKLLSDAAVLSFGADAEVSLTHVADTGILLNSTNVIQFNDASQNIGAPSATVLDINATDEIELNATLVDVNANLDVSGTVVAASSITAASLDISGDVDIDGTTNLDVVDIDGAVDMASTLGVTGIATFADDIIIGDGKTIGSASDVDAITIASNGQVTLTQTLIGTALDISGDVDIDGTTNLDIVDIDGAVNIAAATTIATTNKIQFRDTALFINSSADGQLDLAADTEIELTATTVDVVGNFTNSGTIVSAGKITADAGIDIDNFNIDGTTIALSSGDLTVDVAGDIILNTDDGIVRLADASVIYGELTNSSSDFVVQAMVQDKDIIFKGDDGGSGITALTLDMSDAGSAAFNDKVTIGDGKLVLNSTAVTSTAAELNLLDTAAANSVVNSKAVIYGSSGELAGTLSTAAQGNVTSLGTLTALTVDDVAINGKIMTMTGSSSDTAVFTVGTNGTLSIVTTDDAAAAANITITADGTSELAGTTVTLNSSGGVTIDADGGTITFADAGSSLGTITSSGYSGVAAVATAVTITDNESTNENNAIIFAAGGDTDGGNLGLESDGNLTYNPSTGTLSATNLVVTGTQTITNSVTMNASNAVVFEGSTADDHETTLSTIDATGDRTINLPNVSGTLPVLAAVSTTQISSTPEELNILDGATVVVGEINALDLGSTAVGNAIASKAVILDSNKDYTGIRNLTITGAGSTAALTASGILKTDDTTAATSTTDGSLQTDGGLSVAGDAVIGDDLFMLSDAAQVTFGADKDVTLTHVADTGLLVNAAMVVQFRDSAINIGSPADGDLDINADDEIELNSTLIDINGNVDISGTTAAGGDITRGGTVIGDGLITDTGNFTLDVVGDISLDADGGDIRFKDAGTQIGSVSFSSQNLTIGGSVSNKDIILQVVGNNTALVIDGSDSGNATFNGAVAAAAGTFSGILKTDDTTAATSTTDGSLQTDGGLSVALDAVIGDDIIMLSDASTIHFGANSEVTLTHVHDVGLTLTHTAAGDNTPIVLQLKSEEDAIVANEVIGSIEFAAGDSDGTDGATVAAGIHAIAEDTFSASANATKLVFTAGVSETAAASATAKMTLSSAGLLTIADDFMMKDGGTIGVASVNDAMTISSGGIVTFKDDIIIKDGGTIGSASDVDAISIGSDGDVTLTQDLELQHDGAILSFGANDDVTLTHVHNTGLLLNAAMVVQFRDSAINIGSPADGDLDINADDEIELNSTLIDVNGNLDVSGTIVGASTLSATTGTFSGVLKTDDNTAATSTTDGSLQTDGGLSVVLDAVIGDDIIMLSDGAVIHFGTNSEVTMTHVHNVGLTITHTGTGDNLPVVLQLKSEEDAIVANEVIASLEFAAGDSDGTDGATVAAGIHAIAEDTFSASANATKLVFTTGVSETAASSATAKATLSSIGDFQVAGDLVVKDGGLIGSASDLDAMAIASNGVVTFSQIPVLPNDSISSAELKTLSTLLIINSAGSTVKTIHGAGA